MSVSFGGWTAGVSGKSPGGRSSNGVGAWVTREWGGRRHHSFVRSVAPIVRGSPISEVTTPVFCADSVWK